MSALREAGNHGSTTYISRACAAGDLPFLWQADWCSFSALHSSCRPVRPSPYRLERCYFFLSRTRPGCIFDGEWLFDRVPSCTSGSARKAMKQHHGPLCMHPLFLCLGCVSGIAACGFFGAAMQSFQQATISDPTPPDRPGLLRRILSRLSGYGDLVRFLSLWRHHPESRPLVYWALAAGSLTILFLCLAFPAA